MNDASFRRFGAVCALAFAVCTFLYAVVLALGSRSAGIAGRLEAAVQTRAMSQPANLLLGMAGLLATVGVVAVYELISHRGSWARWAAAVGILGAVMTAIHGVWDFLRVPVLQAQWDSQIEARQAAISAFAGVPNPADPRGLGALLLMGLFVLVAARLLMVDGQTHALLGPVGLAYGVLALVAFVAGFVGPDATRAGLVALSVGIAGPIWWALVAAALWRSTPA
jgi:hypothetical protein